jgi:lipopolysaccharide export LptBFGC system permease protein LptF
METKVLVRKLLGFFGLAFVFFFFMFFLNQLIFLFRGITENKPTSSEYFDLIMYSLPTVFIMSIPFAVCMGFIQFFISVDIRKIINKKIVLIVFCFGTLFSVVGYFITDFVSPKANASFSKIYREFMSIDPDRQHSVLDGYRMREMNSFEIAKSIDTISKDKGIVSYESILNKHKLELQKKFSLPFGSLIFSFFAISISLLINKRKIIGLLIGVFSCILYWALFRYGESFSINNGKSGALIMWFPNILFFCITICLYILYRRKNKKNAKGFNVA